MAATDLKGLFTNSSVAPRVNIVPTPSPSRPFQMPIKTASEARELQLNLINVVGTTTSSARGFDCLQASSCFAICTGSAVILNQIDEKSNVHQRIFRASPNISTTPSMVSSVESIALFTPEPRVRSKASLRGNIYSVKPLASPLVTDSALSPGKSSVRQRIRATSCVALSPDGKLVAVGETGYNPRILLFSTATENTDIPVTTLYEHSFGVRCLAFSPDSRWLCTVGDLHDGFVYLWSISPKNSLAKLHSSNKCTSLIHDIAWINNSVVTVGTRHVKVWRLEQTVPGSPSKSKQRLDSLELSVLHSPGPKALPGRNCILGSLLEAMFTCVAAVSESRAILCTDKGDICVLDDCDNAQRLDRLFRADFGIQCCTFDSTKKILWIGGSGGELQALHLKDLRSVVNESLIKNAALRFPKRVVGFDERAIPGFLAVGSITNPDRLVTVDSTRAIKIHGLEEVQNLLSTGTDIKELPAHSNSVLGINILCPSDFQAASFMTWATGGAVMFWSLQGSCKMALSVPLDPSVSDDAGEPNELKVIRASSCGTFFVSGDKCGILRLLLGNSWLDNPGLKAHQGEINDIALVQNSDNLTLVTSCSRDRTIQIFKKDSSNLVLLQTIVDQHGSSINQLLFLEKGRILLSSSSDRTVSIHALAIANASMAYIATRTITLKASPMSMTVTPEDPTILIISTMDRQLHKYDVSTGQLIYSVRLWDDETHESILLSSITMRTDENHGSFRRIVLGVSSTDKSVRVHDLETGATIVKDYGHSEGISDIATIQNEVLRGNACYTLISTSFDGTIMLWDLRCQTSMPAEINMPVTPAQDGTNSSKPLRRILSRSVLAEYSKSLEANGPSSPATPRRSQSPSRLRRKPSRFSIANPSTSRTIPSFNRPLNRSPSPTSPSTPIIEKQRPALDRSRTKSVGNFNESKVSMEQMCRSLRALRKKLLTASEILRSEGANELERELGLTSNAIMQHKKRQQAASESIETIVLERSSEKLAKTVEQKVAIEIAKHGGSSIEEASPSIMVIEKTGSSAESVGKG